MKLNEVAVLPLVAVTAMVIIGLAACDEVRVNVPAKVEVRDERYIRNTIEPQVEIKVTVLGEFKDELAYKEKRKIYLFDFPQKKIKLIGVTGVGIDRIEYDEDMEKLAEVAETAVDVLETLSEPTRKGVWRMFHTG